MEVRERDGHEESQVWTERGNNWEPVTYIFNHNTTRAAACKDRLFPVVEVYLLKYST